MNRTSRTLCVIAVAVFCPASTTAQTIRPRFAWTNGSAEVTTTTEVTASGLPTALPTRTMRVVQDLSVKSEPRGLIISATGRSASGMGTASQASAIDQFITHMQNRYVVTPAGVYRFALDTTVALARSDSAFKALNSVSSPNNSLPSSNVADMLLKLTPATLDSSYRRQWDLLVGQVLSRQWARGDSVTSSMVVEIPNDSGRKLAIPRVLRFDGVVPCPAADSSSAPSARTCWQFSSTMRFPPEFMRPTIERTKANMASRLPPEVASQLDAMIPVPEQSMVQTSIYDAATLRPLRIVSTSEVVSRSTSINSRITTVSTSRYAWH